MFHAEYIYQYDRWETWGMPSYRDRPCQNWHCPVPVFIMFWYYKPAENQLDPRDFAGMQQVCSQTSGYYA